MQFYPLEKLINLYDGYRQSFRLGDNQLLLVQTDNELFLLESRCPHQGQSLAKAVISGDTIRCPSHAYEFSLRSGKPLRNTAEACRALRVYPVSYEGRDVGVVL